MLIQNTDCNVESNFEPNYFLVMSCKIKIQSTYSKFDLAFIVTRYNIYRPVNIKIERVW